MPKEKSIHPQVAMHDAMIGAGWEKIRPPDPRAYKRANISYLTWLRGGVMLATGGSGNLVAYRGIVEIYHGEPNEVIIHALHVDPAMRRRGLARQTLAEITRIADAAGITLYLEPVPLEKGQITKDALVAMYSTAGFKTLDESAFVLCRQSAKLEVAHE